MSNLASAITDLSDSVIELASQVNNLRQMAVQSGEITEQQNNDYVTRLETALKSSRFRPTTPTGKPPVVAPGAAVPGLPGPSTSPSGRETLTRPAKSPTKKK